MPSIFGWSYPAGCSGPPDDENPYCEVCGGNVDNDKCICRECPTCGEAGNPKCYEEHGLVKTAKQLESKKKFDAFMEKAAQDEHEAEVAMEKELALLGDDY